MYKAKQVMGTFLVVFFCLSLSGCWFVLGGAAGGGTAIYFKGRLQEDIGRYMHEVLEATRSALVSLNLPVEKEEKKVDSTSFESKYPDGTNVWINLSYRSANTTRITIRVGIVGDESRSRQIWEEIRRHLN